MEKEPLVTVAVVSYNSAPFIIELLDSVKRQTYKNIELIISDDASTDNTVNLCKRWLSENASCFTCAHLIESKINTGISGNHNRALEKVTGEWLKFIAADDLLADNAIEEFLNFCLLDDKRNVVFSDYYVFFDDNEGKRVCQEKKLDFSNVFFGTNVTPQRQYSILLKKFAGNGPSLFIKSSLLKRIGFDDRFPYQEDYALYIALAKDGNKLYRIPENLVYYRENPNSISRQGSKNQFYGNNHRRVIMEYKCMYRYENMNVFWKLMMRVSLFLNTMIFVTGNNRESILCNICYYSQRLFDPFRWYSLYLKILEKLI